MVGGFVSLLNTSIPPDFVDAHGLHQGAMIKASICPIRRHILRDHYIDSFYTDEAKIFVCQFPQTGQAMFAHHFYQQIILLGMLILLMGKNLTAEAFENWVKKQN